MRVNRILLVVLAFAALGLTGCGGLSAAHSVSPLGFFLPGLVQATPQAGPEGPVHSLGDPSSDSQKI